MAKIETSTQNPAEASIFLRNTVGNITVVEYNLCCLEGRYYVIMYG